MNRRLKKFLIIIATLYVLIFHGTDDFVVDYKNSEKLSKIDTQSKLTFITIPGGTHHDLLTYEVYKTTLDSIL